MNAWGIMERLSVEPFGSETRAWQPVIVQTRTHHQPVDPVAYDCVKIMLIRDGAVTLLSEFGKCEALPGDLVVLCATTLLGAIPQLPVTVSTVYIDPDYLLDQVLWNHAEEIGDRLSAQALVEHTYHFRAQVLHLPERTAFQIGQLLDGIATEQADTDFFRTQARFSLLMRLLATLMPIDNRHERGMHSFPSASKPHKRAKYAPVRHEILRIERALRADLSRRWTVQEMAEIAYLSPRHLTRVFIDSLGRTPVSYLMMLRAKEMSRLLRETRMSIAEAGRAVGWSSRSHAREAFISCIGMSPAEYRLRFAGRDTDAWHWDTDESAPQIS